MARQQQMQFVSLNLTRDDVKPLEEYTDFRKNDPVALVMELLGDGYKVSQSWVDNRNAFCVTLIGTDFTKQNTGYCMSSWSDELEEAIFIMGYKHYVIAKGGKWDDYAKESTNWG